MLPKFCNFHLSHKYFPLLDDGNNIFLKHFKTLKIKIEIQFKPNFIKNVKSCGKSYVNLYGPNIFHNCITPSIACGNAYFFCS